MEDSRTDAFSIADLAERAGLTRRTIRYYVAEGLLPPPAGRGQRRVYCSEHVLRLQAILRLKEAFLPLSEIRRRLRELSSEDLRRIAAVSPNPSPREIAAAIGAMLAGPLAPGLATSGPRRPADGPSPVSPLSSLLGRAADGGAGSGAALPPGRSPDAPGVSSQDVWHRVALGPGVELHYQPSNDRRRDEAIAHLIRAAASILATFRPPT
ncbi:MAG TPA: MerR family transcriptional regulator [Chloroflexota bacterium]|nr:MerR family transcriptional regulator [Chloroflexota bacterium]